MSEKLDEFKQFVKSHPLLKQEVIAKRKTWQELYEDYVILGSEAFNIDNNEKAPVEAKEEAAIEKKPSQTEDLIKNIMGYVKKIDPDQVSKTVTSIQKVLELFSSFSAGSAASLLGKKSKSRKSALEKAANSAVSTLNAEANSYVPEGGMAIDGRCVGSNPLPGHKNDAENNAMMTAANDPTSSERAWMTSNGWYNSFKLGDEYYSEDYNTMKNMTTPIHNLGYDYWLASRYVYAGSEVSAFDVRFVNDDGSAEACVLCDMGGGGGTGGRTAGCDFRPVFLLKSDIPVEKIS